MAISFRTPEMKQEWEAAQAAGTLIEGRSDSGFLPLPPGPYFCTDEWTLTAHRVFGKPFATYYKPRNKLSRMIRMLWRKLLRRPVQYLDA